ncbi:MAG: hypothetical protein HQL79_08555 [Magnetococcales bacterium]|nr:hypothetical protein [Magnetococcales bacterium]
MANEAQWGSLPFTEAIQYFRGKVNLPTKHWDDLLGDAHDTAFVVAGAVKADILNDLRTAVDRAIANGTTFSEFQKSFDKTVAQYGWDYYGDRNWRTRIIFETNVRTAYAAGRYQQMTHPDVVARRPYWEYRHGNSMTPRPLHLSWHGTTLPHDDQWWQTHFAPNGYNCKCRIVTRSASDLKRMNKSDPDPSPKVDYYDWTDRNGETHQIPLGIDPGWDYVPGSSRMIDRAKAVVQQKAGVLPAELESRLARIVTPPPVPTSPEEAEALGKTILDGLLQRPSRTFPGQSIGEALKQTKLIDENVMALAREFQESLLADLASVRPIHTPVATVQKSGQAREAIVRASTRFPDDWTRMSDQAGPLNVRLTSGRGWAWTAKQGGVVRLKGKTVKVAKGEGFLSIRADSNAEHELTHRLQSVMPELDAFFQQVHHQRTQGEPLERLMDLYPRSNYKRDEWTRKDKYFDFYQGKEYNGKAMEVMTMTYQALLGRMDGVRDNLAVEKLIRIMQTDPGIVRIALGLLYYWRP